MQRRLPIVLALALLTLTLGCGGLVNLGGVAPNVMSAYVPRWACPTNTPIPTKIKDRIPLPTATPSGPQEYDETFYEEWEQEYPDLGPPFPPPTPYTKSGTTFYLGQLVNLAGGAIDLQLDARPTEIVSGTDRLYTITTTWYNRAPQPIVFAPARQLVISAVTVAGGRQIGGPWSVVSGARIETDAVVSGTLQLAIPPTSEGAAGIRLDIPILAPDGRVQAVDLRLDPPGSTAQTTGNFRVQFIAARDPHCAHPGTLAASYPNAAAGTLPIGLPPGADGVVAFALSQVGRQYCWGGKGWSPCSGLGVTPPCAAYPCWDCSGLMWGAYNSIGISLLHGTSNQQNYPRVPLEQVQPGDLLLFGGINQNGRAASISHVGLYAGDVTGDGTGDLIHAANYPDGVRTVNNVLGNRWYRDHLVVITRPPRGGDA